MVWVMMHMSELVWGQPYAWVYLPVWIVLCGMLVYRFVKYKHVYALVVGTGFTLLRNVSIKKQLIKLFLMIVGVLFLFAALFRPQWSKSEEVVVHKGRDLYIALDISRSMLAADCTPNRLQRAKDKIKYLLKKLSCERVGLILFSGSAFVQCPLTTDYGAFYLYLDAVDAELISSGTTSLDQAITQAIKSFEATPHRKNKLLVLFTDGEDFSHNLGGVKQEAIAKNLSIFTFGVGSPEGAPIPVLNDHGKLIGHQKDAQGTIVISRLNEDMLRMLSQDAGGSYIRITENNDDVNSFIKKVEAREKERVDEKKYSRFEDQYHYFLFISFLCFFCEWML